MAKTVAPLLPSSAARLRAFGERLRLGRLHRRLTAKQVAERAGMAPMTLRSLERGGAGVTIGAYLAIMQVLGIESDLELLAEKDPHGRALQDARMSAREPAQEPDPAPLPVRPPGRPHAPLAKRAPIARNLKKIGSRRKAVAADRGWADTGGFTSSESLAALISPTARRRGTKR